MNGDCYENSFKNGALPIVVPASWPRRFAASCTRGRGASMTVDLEAQVFTGAGRSTTLD